MNIVEILKEHFSEHMTDDVEKKIIEAFDLRVEEKVAEKKATIKTELEEQTKKELDEYHVELEERLDEYINQVNDEFIEENLKIEESKAKIELAEILSSGLIKTLKENNIEIAIEDKDIIKQLEDENSKLETSLNEAMTKIEEEKKQNFEFEKVTVINSLTEGLADTEKEKIINILEDVVVKDIESFENKCKATIELITEKVEIDPEKVIVEEFDEKAKEPKETDKYIPKWFHK